MKNEIIYEKYISEVLRKLVHLSSCWIVIVYYYFTKEEILLIILPITIVFVLIDFLRRFNLVFLNKLESLFQSVLRESEISKKHLVGASYFLISVSIVILCFDKITASFGILVLIISDSAAALVGKKFGYHKIKDKSLEGSIAFIISGILISYLLMIIYEFHILYLFACFIAVFASSIVELLFPKEILDDNFNIPIFACITVKIFYLIITNNI